MKNSILYILGIVLLIGVYAFNNPKVDFNKESENGIKFYKGTWEQTIVRSKTEHKLIFLDIYASWCGPCKKLAKYTFSNEEVGSFYNQNFINVSLDGEKGEGAILANKLGITGYPTLLFLNANGEVVKGTMGYHNSKELLELGKSMKSVK
jgi:thioredoxin 1